MTKSESFATCAAVLSLASWKRRLKVSSNLQAYQTTKGVIRGMSNDLYTRINLISIEFLTLSHKCNDKEQLWKVSIPAIY